PEQSRIPGVKLYHEQYGREICPNGNTLEDSLDQYDSMIKEKTLADPSRQDPRWLQILPSSELAPWKRFWPVVPTHHHGGIDYGAIRADRCARPRTAPPPVPWSPAPGADSAGRSPPCSSNGGTPSSSPTSTRRPHALPRR